MSESTEQVEVTRNDAAGRYDITVDGELAGFTEFVDHDGQRIFPHTELDDKFSGRGLSSVLIRQALADTRAAGQRIVPICPLVARYISKHEDEVGDIVDRATPEALEFLKSR
ncbi:N-acetyltransferase [Gordonia sp. HY442]|uniref:GNAT family N-acetyltransferase n=1 Tax=Gordonia zhenghanii TaxID=2911516 RepID=UPI001F3232C0|nr:GNAT family N-acetyltransferase [Gordonia zhenghanii]MCF8607452.1 N-acetyltransferase [Gordonia zhenghanii]